MHIALHVAGIGMVTAIGDDTHNTIVALAAGAKRVRRANLTDLAGDRISGAFAFPVRAEHEGFARASVLAWPALVECLDEMGPVDGPTGLIVCTPLPWSTREARQAVARDARQSVPRDVRQPDLRDARQPDLRDVRQPDLRDARQAAPLAEDVATATAQSADNWPLVVDALAHEIEARGANVPSGLRLLVRRGHASGVLALRTAAQLFERQQAAQVVIGGLDTHGEPATLERLDRLGLLKSRRSPGGFLPGEASAAVCVRPASGRERGVLVHGVGVEVETEAPGSARSLTAAVAQAIDAWGGDPATIGAVAIDLNGESERAREWCCAATKTIYRQRATPVLLHPADRLGDIGAASVPLLVGLVVSAQTPGPALVVASSRDGLRGAAVVA